MCRLITSNSFSLTISIKKTEVVHQPKPMPKSIHSVWKLHSVHIVPSVSIIADGKYLKSF